MPELKLYNRPVDSFFELLGTKENSLTFALGWCLRDAPSLLDAIADLLGIPRVDADLTTIMMQQFTSEFGITDIEIREPGRAAWVLEAKVGFLPPTINQMQMYADRLNAREDFAATPVIIVLAQSDRRNLALAQSLPKTLADIPIKVLSWAALVQCCDQASPTASKNGKWLLSQLSLFIKKVLLMRDQESNKVYVVSIGSSFWKYAGATFREIVEKHGRYFHPVEKNWPKSPPNYLGFRYDGHLQSIHHVDSYKIVTNMRDEFPDAIDEELAPYFLYTLGPAIRPAKIVKNGPQIVMANRVWASLDLLLTSESISEAYAQTKLRLNELGD